MARWIWLSLALAAMLVAISPVSAPLHAEGGKPTDGWTLHIDAKLHFPGRPEMVAHHYCKQVAGSLTECQLYDVA